jgi:DNA-binding transcriptional MerR regulator
VIDADEIAETVNKRSGDEVSARMVREYVRLGIVDKALHPGRRGFGVGAVDQMLQARSLVKTGLSLKKVSKQMQATPGRHARVQTQGRTGKPTFWISLGEAGRVGLELPKSMSPAMAEEVVAVSEKALIKWARKNKVRKTEDV